jgi:hypothetical protein
MTNVFKATLHATSDMLTRGHVCFINIFCCILVAFAEYAFIKNQRRLQLSIQHYSEESLRQVKNKTQTTEAGSNLNETTMENNTGTETEVWTNSTKYVMKLLHTLLDFFEEND